MNNLKLYQKILAVNLLLSLIITIIFTIGQSYNGDISEFAIGFGVMCLIAAALNLVAAFIMLIAEKKEWRNGFFISAGILLLVSGISCGTGLGG